MEIIKNDKYNYFYDGKIKLIGYGRFRIMRLINSQTFLIWEYLLTVFHYENLYNLLFFIMRNFPPVLFIWEIFYFSEFSKMYNGKRGAIDGKSSQPAKSGIEGGGALM